MKSHTPDTLFNEHSDNKNSNSSIDYLNQKQKKVLERLNSGLVMEALALNHYVHIHQTIDTTDFKNIESDKSLRRKISHDAKDWQIWGSGYSNFDKLYLKKDLQSLTDNFYDYKLSQTFSDSVLPGIQAAQAKKNILSLSRQILDTIRLTEMAPEIKTQYAKYNELARFNVRQVLSAGAQFDSDFKKLGKKLFPNFDLLRRIDNPELLGDIEKALNLTANPLKINTQDNHTESLNSPAFEFNQDKIAHLYQFIDGTLSLHIPLFKQLLKSHEKGVLGEELYSKIFGGKVVGYLNQKADVILDQGAASIKTSYSDTWNNHLAYMNEHDHFYIIEALDKKIPLHKIENINWHDTMKSFFKGHEDIKTLVFQQATLDEYNKQALSLKVWSIDIDQVLNLIHEKSFIFQNNNLVIFKDQEQILKINFKKRTDKCQVMVLADTHSLNSMIGHGMGTYQEPLKISEKQKISL